MHIVRAVALAAAVAGCGGNRYAPPPPPEVTVSKPVSQEVTTYNEFTGHTVAVEAIDIRARVQGYLQSVNFTPGTEVKQGDLLFVIEPVLYQSKYDQAAADLEGKEAQARAAEAQLQITQAIYARSAGSRTDLVQKTQERDLAKAQAAMARATLDAARLDLSYTRIYAPISGRIDRNLVDVGNLVGVGEATVLATIVRPNPVYVYFTASERELLQFRELQREDRTVARLGENGRAYLGLVTETGFPHVGEISYSSNRVDPDTGTIELRAVFPNTSGVLVPGLFARIRLPFTREKALLVPDVAIESDQGGRFLLTVDDKDTVQYHRIEVGPMVESGMRVVQDGITADDWVVVNGLQRARPGAIVKPTRTETAAPAAPNPTAPTPAS